MTQKPVSSKEQGREGGRPSLARPLRELLEDAGSAWALPPGAILGILLAPLLVMAIGVGTALVDKELYKSFTREDGIAENLQILFYLLALGMTGVVGRGLWKRGERGLAALYSLLFIGLFFLTGEEMSWGQRIFDWGTPEALRAINKQEETNLHNIHGVGYTFKWIQLLVGAYGTVLPLLTGWSLLERFRKPLAWLIPHFSLIPCFGAMFFWKLYRNLFEAPQEYYFAIAKFNEVIELALALGFFFFLVFQVRRSRRPEPSPSAHPVGGVVAS